MIDPASSLVLSQVTVSTAVIAVTEGIKKLSGKKLSPQAVDVIQHFCAAIGSLGAAFGLHMTYVAGTGDLIVHGLTLTNMVWGAGHWLRSFVVQEMEYRGYKFTKMLPQIQQLINLLQQVQPPSAPKT